MNISDDPKSVKVSIRFTDQEIEYLEKKALDSNCIWNKNPCISQFIRLCVLNEGKVYIYKEFKPILMQIRKIGTNLNYYAGYPAVRCQQIRTVSDHLPANAVDRAELNQRRHLAFVIRTHQNVAGAADLKGGVIFHQRVQNILALQILT